MPGGRVEHGETLAEAVVRELWEETRVAGVCGELLGWVERITDETHFVILDFRVTVLDDPVTSLRAGSDAAEAAWVALDDVAHLTLTEGLAEFLHDHGIMTAIA